MKVKVLLLLTISFHFWQSNAQVSSTLAPGFDARECDAIMSLNQFTVDSSSAIQFSKTGMQSFSKLNGSDSLGLDNAWQLWLREDATPVILLQGTTADIKSILSDLYCEMMPAAGTIHYSATDSFTYQLAKDPKAAVHAGFLMGFAYIAKDLAPGIDSLYKKGHRNIIVSGHSQGGSLSFYVSAWLHYLRINNVYPNLRIKTYATAPPKTGNTYFVNDYDNVTRAEWSFSVISSSDPVPEMPFTTQQLTIDVNDPNPLLMLKKGFDKAPLLKRWILKSAFNKMEKRARKSSEAYQKYLGKYVGGYLKGFTPGLTLPAPVATTNFFRPGVSIALIATDNYYSYFENRGQQYFNHNIASYRYLLHQYYPIGSSEFQD